MPNITSLSGPLERIDGKFFLHIPLNVGGDKLIECSKGISVVKDGLLIIEIKKWLVEKLNISEGSMITVSNIDGKFNLHPQDPKNT